MSGSCLKCLLYITNAGCKACLIGVYFVVLLSRRSKTNISATGTKGLLASFDARLRVRFNRSKKTSTPACRLTLTSMAHIIWTARLAFVPKIVTWGMWTGSRSCLGDKLIGVLAALGRVTVQVTCLFMLAWSSGPSQTTGSGFSAPR